MAGLLIAHWNGGSRLFFDQLPKAGCFCFSAHILFSSAYQLFACPQIGLFAGNVVLAFSGFFWLGVVRGGQKCFRSMASQNLGKYIRLTL